jgi:GT2 family glycosyltransferase
VNDGWINLDSLKKGDRGVMAYGNNSVPFTVMRDMADLGKAYLLLLFDDGKRMEMPWLTKVLRLADRCDITNVQVDS